jgi:hypothetical protein
LTLRAAKSNAWRSARSQNILATSSSSNRLTTSIGPNGIDRIPISSLKTRELALFDILSTRRADLAPRISSPGPAIPDRGVLPGPKPLAM